MRRLCCQFPPRDAGTALAGTALLAALCVALCPEAAKAQAGGAKGQAQAAPPLTGLVLEKTVRRVVVDVVVTDHHGKPVTGLSADDFRVFEDGKPQTIMNFEALTPANGEVLPARPAALPADTFVNLPATPEEEHAPLTVILFDALNTHLKDQMYARQQLIRFLKKMPAGVPTAIFVLSDRLHLFQGFSGEREVLLEAAKRLGPVPDKEGLLPTTGSNGTGSALEREEQLSPGGGNTPPGVLPGQGTPSSQSEGMPVPVSGPMAPDALLAHMADEVGDYMLDQRVDITLAALQQIGRFLSSAPGRKNLIWISGSFPDFVPPDVAAGPMMFESERSYNQQIVDTDDLLCTSQVAVYPVDARGLMAPTPSEEAETGPAQAYAAQNYVAQLAAGQGTLQQIADETGGTAYYNTNQLAKAFQSALDDGSNYYSLSYAPTDPNFNGKLRHIQLKVDHSGYHLAYRRGYYALGEGQNGTEADALANAQPGSLMSALEFGAPQAHDLIFAARVNAVGGPARASREQMAKLTPFLKQAAAADALNFSKPKQPVEMQRYLVHFGVMAREMEMPRGNDGKYHAELEFATMAYDAEGNPLGGAQTMVDAGIPAAEMDQLKKEGYQAFQNVYVPVEAASLRIAVRDSLSSRIGSLEVPLPLAPVAAAAGK